MEFLSQEERDLYFRFKEDVKKYTNSYDQLEQPASTLLYSNMLVGRPTQIYLDPQVPSKIQKIQPTQQTDESSKPSKSKQEFFKLIDKESRTPTNITQQIFEQDIDLLQPKFSKQITIQDQTDMIQKEQSSLFQNEQSINKHRTILEKDRSKPKNKTPAKTLKKNESMTRKPNSNTKNSEYNQKLYKNLEKLVSLKNLDAGCLLKIIQAHMNDCPSMCKEIKETIKKEVKNLSQKM